MRYSAKNVIPDNIEADIYNQSEEEEDAEMQ